MTSDQSSYSIIKFSEFTVEQLYQVMQLRSAVFVLEQACAYQDLDDEDHNALHVIKTDHYHHVIAYARILAPSQCKNSHCSIGRVVVSPSHRHEKLGYALMQRAINCCLKAFPEHQIIISAQTYLTHFYEKLGFVNTGQFYLEDQIPHQQMVYQPT